MMTRPVTRITVFLSVFALIMLPAATSAADVRVPRWQPQDFPFAAPAAEGNPFRVTFSADVTGPGGERLKVPGFYDGDATWKVRVSPTAEGEWSLVTHGSTPALEGRRATFTCTGNPWPGVHGGLRIDPERHDQFVWEDGTRFFSLGYECDWLWALDANDPGLRTINPFLDKLAASGFDNIILNAYAHDTSWRKGNTAADDYGPPPVYAWKGSNDQPDFSEFNMPFWRHYDRVMEAMYRRGIVAHVLLRVYNKQVKWPANGSPEDEMYFRWLLARYAAYPNVTWDLAKEAQYEKDVRYKVGRLNFIRELDPYRRLLTIHDDRAEYDKGTYDDVVDYRSDQQHAKWRETLLVHRRQRAWPVINTEFGYEQGPGGAGDKTYNRAQPPEEVARRAWEVYTAGGKGAYYYTYTAWDVLRPQDTPPGYAYFKNLSDFFRRTAYWKLQPADGLTSDGFCLADPGKEYVAFLDAAAPFTLKLGGAAAPLKAEWFHPFTGAREPAGTLDNGTATLIPPPSWGAGPVALHVVAPPK